MSNELKAANRTLEDMTGLKYCQSCRLGRSPDGGSVISNSKGRVYGWRCAICTNLRKKQKT